MKQKTWFAACVAFSVFACGGGSAANSGSNFGRDDVDNLPPGDAIGTALSRVRRVTIRTTECKGQCTITAFGQPYSLCDIGMSSDEQIKFTQTDGVLKAEVLGETPRDYAGGVNLDGSFTVGAYATQLGTLEIAALAEGTIDVESIAAVVSSRSWGSYDGRAVDCVGVRTIEER